MSDKKQSENIEIILDDVRLSHPALWKPKKFQGSRGSGRRDDDNSKPRYQASFLISKKNRKDLIQKIDDAVFSVEESFFGKGGRLPVDKLPFRDGDKKLEEEEAYLGHMYLACARAESNGPPSVVDSRRDAKGKFIRLDGSEGIIYAGCRVNAVVRIWAQDAFGARVNATVESVQFYADDIPLTQATAANPDEKFDGMEGKSSDRDHRDSDRENRRETSRGETGRDRDEPRQSRSRDDRDSESRSAGSGRESDRAGNRDEGRSSRDNDRDHGSERESRSSRSPETVRDDNDRAPASQRSSGRGREDRGDDDISRLI